MLNEWQTRLDFDKLLCSLFCLYALSLPYELVLEFFFSIETIFKPFRVISLVIIGVYFIRVLMQGMVVNREDWSDWLLYSIFIYGVIISCIRIVGGLFSMNLFTNDIFQIGLYALTFFIFKTTTISSDQRTRMMWYFVAGVLINSIYMTTYSIVNVSFERQAGFIDNPNYAAFGLVAAILFLVMKTTHWRSFIRQLFLFSGVSFMVYAFGTTGSRTGVVLLLFSLFAAFFFFSVRRKIFLFFVGFLATLLLIPQQFESLPFVGRVVVVDRITHKLDSDVEDVRFALWRGALRSLEQEGYAGMGIGQFKAKFTTIYNEETNLQLMSTVNWGYFLSIHNDYLALLTDYGLPGLIFYLSFLILTFRKLLLQLIYAPPDKEKRVLIQFNFMFFICILIFGLASENFLHHLYWFLLMFTSKRVT